MEQSVLEKVKRFVELSAKFSKSESDIFPNKKEMGYSTGSINFVNGGGSFNSVTTFTTDTMYVNGNFVLNGREIYIDRNGEIRTKDNKPLTRGEQFQAEAKALALVSDEFDEYNNLRSVLGEYFSALNKIQKLD